MVFLWVRVDAHGCFCRGVVDVFGCVSRGVRVGVVGCVCRSAPVDVGAVLLLLLDVLVCVCRGVRASARVVLRILVSVCRGVPLHVWVVLLLLVDVAGRACGVCVVLLGVGGGIVVEWVFIVDVVSADGVLLVLFLDLVVVVVVVAVVVVVIVALACCRGVLVDLVALRPHLDVDVVLCWFGRRRRATSLGCSVGCLVLSRAEGAAVIPWGFSRRGRRVSLPPSIAALFQVLKASGSTMIQSAVGLRYPSPPISSMGMRL